MRRSGILFLSILLASAASTRAQEPGVHLATFSIVARDPANGDLGVAVSTALPAVGMLVPLAEAGVGAVANQAQVNPAYGPEALRLLREGRPPEEILKAVQAKDPEFEKRQIAVVDAQGRAAAFTGKGNGAWAGHVVGEGFACQGNLLVGKETVDAMAETFRRTPGDLAERLLSALEAAQVVGGDRRGKQSAALLVVRKGAFFYDKLVDLRVDDHPEPVRELRRVHGAFLRDLARRPDPLRPPIVTREEWGAKPVKGLGKFQFPERITIHHAGVTYKTDKPWIDHVRGLQRYSQEDKPWIDIPYHYCVAQDGTIYEARPYYLAGDTNTEYDPAGHFLIDVFGNFEEEPVVEKQVEAAARLAAWAAKKFGIPPDRIGTHKDYSKQTACPGRNLYALFKDGSFLRKVEALVGK